MKTTTKIIALVDINNCYVSCERVFNPKLNGRPVIVLSNNDGCAVARSQEAKDLGIKMGVPLFQIRDLVHRHDIQVLSSNYALYGEMSQRFHALLGALIGQDAIEIYSIDECFLDLTAFQSLFDLQDYCQHIKQQIWQCLGLPVCIGLGASKTEAKLANHIAKKQSHFNGVCDLGTMDMTAKESLFQQISVSEIWGVGRQHTKKLAQLGIHSVFDLAVSPPQMIRKQFSIVLERTVLELQGISCIELEQQPQSRKQIISSRSFGQKVTALTQLQQAIASYVEDAYYRLREQNLCCGYMTVFLQSNPFDEHQPFYNRSLSVEFSQPTDYLLQLTKEAVMLMAKLYQADIAFKKCGVILTGLEPKSQQMPDLLADPKQLEKRDKLITTFDAVQQKYGKGRLTVATQLSRDNNWSMNRQYLTPNPFRWESLLRV